MHVVISGYYGFGNVGDEAVLAATLGALRARVPSARFTVLSANPRETERSHTVNSVSRAGIGAVRAIAGADLFLSGGGSLIQDVTSARSALYYLGLLGLATMLSRRTMVFAQGIGPLRRRWVRALARGILNRVHLVTVRDEDSQRLLQEFGIRQTAHVVADPVFALVPAPRQRGEDILGDAARPRIGLALRSWGNDGFLLPLIEAITSIRGRIGGTAVVLAFHPERDLPICRTASVSLGGRLVGDLSPEDTMAVVGCLDVLVGVRLHALMCAVAMGVVPVGISYDPKVDGLFRRIGIGHLLPLQHLQPGPLKQAVMSAWGSREDLRPQLLRAAALLREDALRAVDLAAALLTSATPA